MRHLISASIRLLGVGMLLTGAAMWAGIDHVGGMAGAVSFAFGFLVIALGTLVFMVEADQ